MTRLHGEQGQALVGVLVLLALLFFVGTAMSLSVSTALTTGARTATNLASGYAAESAASRGALTAVAAAAATNGGPCPRANATIDGQPATQTSCLLAGVDIRSGPSVSAAGSVLIPDGGCTPASVGFLTPPASMTWTNLSWRRVSGTPTLHIVLDNGSGCAPNGTDPGAWCDQVATPVVASFSCQSSPGPKAVLRLYSIGGGARVATFLVRSAPAPGNGCIAAAVGTAGVPATQAVEVDVALPLVDEDDEDRNGNRNGNGPDPVCDATGSRVTLTNRLSP